MKTKFHFVKKTTQQIRGVCCAIVAHQQSINMDASVSLEIMDVKPLNLVDIHDDCKELIFEHLEFADLVNIAETSKQLNKAVCAVFKRNYGNYQVAFRDYHGRASDIR